VKRPTLARWAWLALFLSFLPALGAASGREAERRVLDYLRNHLQPGQPLLVTELYNQVFTQPGERQALEKLYNSFFRIPLFVAQYQERYGKPPSLSVIAQQFDLESPQAADILVRVMEADPRVPRFFTRNLKTGEMTHVDIAAIRSDPNFGRALDRQLGGWEGKPAPDLALPSLSGPEVHLRDLRGQTVLLYVWFTGCPPCMRETPELVTLAREYARRSFVIIAANADRLLGLSYDDAVRRQYVTDQKISFPVVHWTKAADEAFGNISIFPNLFLIDPKGVIISHWVGYTTPEELRHALSPQSAGLPRMQ